MGFLRKQRENGGVGLDDLFTSITWFKEKVKVSWVCATAKVDPKNLVMQVFAVFLLRPELLLLANVMGKSLVGLL